MFIKERMESEHFPDSEKVIIRYMLEQELDIEQQSSTQIAKATFSSKSTLVKLAKRLNFSGWSELKKAFLSELRYQAENKHSIDANYPFTAKDNLLTIAKNLAILKQEAIKDTLALQNYTVLKQVGRLLNKSSCIHIFAVTNNNLLALEFQYNMARINKEVKVHCLQGSGSYASLLADKNDCAVIISYSGETKTLVRYAKTLRYREVPLVLISNRADSTISNLANYHLPISTRENLYSKISTFSNDCSINYLLDLLYAAVFQTDYLSNLHLRENSSRIFEVDRQNPSSIIKA